MSSPLVEIVDALRAYAERHADVPVLSGHGARAQRAPVVADRRAYVRLRPVQLERPVLARLKPGPLLTLVDVSAGGALIETQARLTPGAHVLLEFLAPGSRRAAVLRSRIIRSQVAALDAGNVRYRGACSFDEMLRLADLLGPGQWEGRNRQAICTDLVLPTALQPHLARLAACSRATPSDTLRELRRLLTTVPDSSDREVTELLDHVDRVAPPYASRGTLMAYVDKWLRRRVPLLALRVSPGGDHPSRGDGLLSFTLPGTEGSGRSRAHVEFRPACALDDSQVRMLEAGACILGLLSHTR